MNIENLSSKTESIQRVTEILSSMENSDYLLMLSGGDSPVALYKHLSTSFGFPFPKHIAMVDERWGDKSLHENSNELIIKNSGLLGRMIWEKSEFHPILSANLSNPKVEASGYEKELLDLFSEYSGRVIAIMGMGVDGHTAGILPHSEGVESDHYFIAYEGTDKYGVRLTVTAACIIEHFSKSVLLLNTEEKCGLFNRIIDREEDMHEFPSLIYKSMADVDVFCYPED